MHCYGLQASIPRQPSLPTEPLIFLLVCIYIVPGILHVGSLLNYLQLLSQFVHIPIISPDQAVAAALQGIATVTKGLTSIQAYKS